MLSYRPEYHLDRLRTMTTPAVHVPTDNADGSSVGGSASADVSLHLRWLRTMVVDLSRMSQNEPQKAFDRLALQQRSSCAVEHVVGKRFQDAHLSRLVPFLTLSVSQLTSLDLRDCDSKVIQADEHLAALADGHRASLRRLSLPWCCRVSQWALDRFTQLEELEVTDCHSLTNVDFCSATLRVLYANYCSNLTNDGLRNATRLEVLHISECPHITNLSPFAQCLLELDASGRSCGVDSEALVNCHRLQVLNTFHNQKIVSLQPFARRLREIDAGMNSSLNNSALVDATGIVKLQIVFNTAITTVEPFGATLRVLDAAFAEIGDAGLVTATNLVYLSTVCAYGTANSNTISTLAPFSSTLLELNLNGHVHEDSIDDAALATASHLIWLNVRGQKRITTIQWCGPSLRHLVAVGKDCALTNEGLSTATQLVTLNCSENPNLTTIAPFRQSLEELVTTSQDQCLEVENAPHLQSVLLLEGHSDESTFLHLKQNGFCLHDQIPCLWFRDAL